MPRPLASIRALLMDMDGVLWRGSRVLPGVPELFAFLRANAIPFLLVTNNATRRAEYGVERLAKLGIEALPSQILTSADATAQWLARQMPEVKRVFVIGEAALMDALHDAGMEPVDARADAVVVGLDRGLTYDKLKRAALEIRRGARFIATNPDRTFPGEEGLLPGAGSLVAAVAAATDVEPIIVGKPYRPLFDLARALLDTAPADMAMLGDRLDTDIDGAAQAGLQTILVLTGVSTLQDLQSHPTHPDYVFEDLPALLRAWEQAPRPSRSAL